MQRVAERGEVMKRSANESVRRVMKYEAMSDDVAAALDGLEAAIDRFASKLGEIDELEEYLSSKRRRTDLAADEAGLLPPDLKRGVLSQDGLYDLLVRAKAARDLIKEKKPD